MPDNNRGVEDSAQTAGGGGKGGEGRVGGSGSPARASCLGQRTDHTSQQIGGALGLAVLSGVASAQSDEGNTTTVEVLTDGYDSAFIGAALIAALGFLVTVTVIRTRDSRAHVESTRPSKAHVFYYDISGGIACAPADSNHGLRTRYARDPGP